MTIPTAAISAVSQAYTRQREMIKLPRALMGGARAMRECGSLYLPKKTAESDRDYKDRLNGAVLVNYFDKTLDYLAGQVFQKPVDYLKVDQNLSPARANPERDRFFADFKENVDLAGNNLSAFALELFKNGVADGVSFVLVDYSRVEARVNDDGVLVYRRPDGTEAPKTLAADRENGWRPYLVSLRAGQVLDAWLTADGGVQRLAHFRYEEFEERPKDESGLNRETIRRIRAFWPGRWEVWESGLNDSAAPVMVAEGKVPLDFIPVYWFRPGSALDGGVTAVPPLTDLAEMNRAHWAAYSNHLELMKWVRSPVWLGINLVDEKSKPLPFGPSHYLGAIVPNGVAPPTLQSVGVNPDSVSKSRDDLDQMQTYMESYGLQVALKPAGYSTATEVATAANASDSQLKGWCVNFQDCLENALEAVAVYLGWKGEGPAVFVNTAFRQTFDSARSADLNAMRVGGDLSLETYLAEKKQMGVLNDEVEIEKELERIEAERERQLPSFSLPAD